MGRVQRLQVQPRLPSGLAGLQLAVRGALADTTRPQLHDVQQGGLGRLQQRSGGQSLQAPVAGQHRGIDAISLSQLPQGFGEASGLAAGLKMRVEPALADIDAAGSGYPGRIPVLRLLGLWFAGLKPLHPFRACGTDRDGPTNALVRSRP